jgi:hypothetical protein
MKLECRQNGEHHWWISGIESIDFDFELVTVLTFPFVECRV